MSLKSELFSILDSLWALHKHSELDHVRVETLKVINDLRELMFALKFAVPKKHVSVSQMWDTLLRAQLPKGAKIELSEPEPVCDEIKIVPTELDSYAVVGNSHTNEYKVVHYKGAAWEPPFLWNGDFLASLIFQTPSAKDDADKALADRLKLMS